VRTHITLFIFFIALAHAVPDQPIPPCKDVRVEMVSSNVTTFSTAGVQIVLRAKCFADNSSVALPASDLILYEGLPAQTPSSYNRVYAHDDALEWRTVKPIETQHTLIVVDAGASQTSSFEDISNAVLSLQVALESVNGQTASYISDGRTFKQVKAWTNSRDATGALHDEIRSYHAKDNTTDLKGFMSKAAATLSSRVYKDSMYSFAGVSTYSVGALIVITNGRDTCGCSEEKNIDDGRIRLMTLVVGEEPDYNALRSLYANSSYPTVSVNLTTVRDGDVRVSQFRNVFDSFNSSIHAEASGWTVMRYCSTRRYYPNGQQLYNNQTQLFPAKITYQSKDVASFSYDASGFKGGCALSAAVRIEMMSAIVLAIVIMIIA